MAEIDISELLVQSQTTKTANGGLVAGVFVKEPKDYASLSEYVDALNRQQDFFYKITNGGGFMGYSEHYSLFTYKRNGEDCEGYKKTSGSYTGIDRKTTYYDASGVDITENIHEVAGTLYYMADATDVVTNLWPLAVVILAVAAVLITLIVNRKK